MKTDKKETVIETSGGWISGRRNQEIYEFLGIPYGTAERFQPPKAAVWEGIYDCCKYGECAVQPNFLGVWPENKKLEITGSNDCLNLNVWTHSIDAEKRQPVVIYVHGGAFQTGKNSVPGRSGDRFMESKNMVFVSVNYRLGALGFLPGKLGGDKALPGKGYNNGMRDLLLAVDWVQKNAAAFGGDPDDITLFGISAGAKAIAALLTTEEIQRSCKKIILESGGMQSFRSMQTAQSIQKKLMKQLPEEKELEDCTNEMIIEAQAKLCSNEGSTCFFGPVWDNCLFYENWREQWKSGKCWVGKAILGSGLWELGKAGERLAQLASTVEQKRELENFFGKNAEMAWKEIQQLSGSAEERWGRVLSDFVYRSPQDMLADLLLRSGCQVWCYSMEYPPAHHGQGFAFLMKETEGKEPTELAEKMREAVQAFICNGSPMNEKLWPEWTTHCKKIWGHDITVEKRGSITPFPEYTYSV